MSTNELSVEISQEKDTAVNQLLDNLTSELDFLVGLSIDERRRLVKMGRKNVDFVERSFRHAEGNPQFLPAYMPIEEFKKDVDSSDWLRKVEKAMDQLSNKLKDTAILAEAEAFQSARLYYNSVKAAARAGDESAEQIARDLTIHYKKRSASKKEEPPQEEPQLEPQQ